jgi:hypothetical protein
MILLKGEQPISHGHRRIDVIDYMVTGELVVGNVLRNGLVVWIGRGGLDANNGDVHIGAGLVGDKPAEHSASFLAFNMWVRAILEDEVICSEGLESGIIPGNVTPLESDS